MFAAEARRVALPSSDAAPPRVARPLAPPHGCRFPATEGWVVGSRHQRQLRGSGAEALVRARRELRERLLQRVDARGSVRSGTTTSDRSRPGLRIRSIVRGSRGAGRAGTKNVARRTLPAGRLSVKAASRAPARAAPERYLLDGFQTIGAACGR